LWSLITRKLDIIMSSLLFSLVRDDGRRASIRIITVVSQSTLSDT